MRLAVAIALLLLAQAAGCLSSSGAGVRGGNEACGADAVLPVGSGRSIEILVANMMDAPTCVLVSFDGTLVAGGEVEGQSPTQPHNNPGPFAAFPWSGRDVLVEIHAEATGRTDAESIRLFDGRTYVAIWVGDADTTVRVYDAPPRWA